MPANGSMVSFTIAEAQLVRQILEHMVEDPKSDPFNKVILQPIIVKIRKRLGLTATPRASKKSKKK